MHRDVTRFITKQSDMPAVLTRKTTIRDVEPSIKEPLASLQVRNPSGNPYKMFMLNRDGELTVGRHPGNQLRFPDTLVSYVHFRIHTVLQNSLESQQAEW